jgi:hypothetical protein
MVCLKNRKSSMISESAIKVKINLEPFFFMSSFYLYINCPFVDINRVCIGYILPSLNYLYFSNNIA